MTWFDVFQGELHSHEFNSPFSGLQLAFFPRTSYNWFSFFRPAYTGFQPFREEILTYVEQQYLEKLFYVPFWAFLMSFALLLWSRTLDSTIRGILTLVLVVWVQWVTFGQRSLCDDSVQNPLWFLCGSLKHLFITWMWFFTLFLAPAGREDLLQKAVQTDLAAVTCSSEKFYLKLLNCPLHICVKQMLFGKSSSCLTVVELMPVCQCILSCGKKSGFYEAGAFLRVSLPFFAQDQEW